MKCALAAPALFLTFAFGLVACSSATPVPPEEGSTPAPTYSPTPVARETAPATSASAPPSATASAVATVEAPPVQTAAPIEPVASASPSASASAAPAAGPAGVKGANIHIGSMTADGLTIEDLSCQADGLGIFGSLVIVSSLSKHKKALTACAAGGDKPRVEWLAAGGKMAQIKVKAKTPAVEKCISKVMASAPAPFEGTCAATLVLGK